MFQLWLNTQYTLISWNFTNWVSLVPTIHCRKKLNSGDMRTILQYGEEHRSSNNSLILCSIRKTIIVSSFWESIIYSLSCLHTQTYILKLRSIYEWVAYPHINYNTAVPISISCLITIVLSKINNQVILLVPFLSQHITLIPYKLASRENLWSLSTWFLHVLLPNCKIACYQKWGYFHEFIMGNQKL